MQTKIVAYLRTEPVTAWTRPGTQWTSQWVTGNSRAQFIGQVAHVGLPRGVHWHHLRDLHRLSTLTLKAPWRVHEGSNGHLYQSIVLWVSYSLSVLLFRIFALISRKWPSTAPTPTLLPYHQWALVVTIQGLVLIKWFVLARITFYFN